MTSFQGQGGGAGRSKCGRKSTAVMSSAVVHTCNSSPCETEAGGSPAPNQPRLQREMCLKKKKAAKGQCFSPDLGCSPNTSVLKA